jgi:hypothetical protein
MPLDSRILTCIRISVLLTSESISQPYNTSFFGWNEPQDKTSHAHPAGFPFTVLLHLPIRLSSLTLRFPLNSVSGFPLPCLSIDIPYLRPSHRQERMGPPKFFDVSLPANENLVFLVFQKPPFLRHISYAVWPRLAMQISCWSPALCPGIWRPPSSGPMRRCRSPSSWSRSAIVGTMAGSSAAATRALVG